MQNCFLNSLWSFGVYSNAIRPYSCPKGLLTLDEHYSSWMYGVILHSVSGRNLELLPTSNRTYWSCPLTISQVSSSRYVAKLEKLEFRFLSYVISLDTMIMDASKVSTILDWKTPTHVKDVQSFFGSSKFQLMVHLTLSYYHPISNQSHRQATYSAMPKKHSTLSRKPLFLCFPISPNQVIMEIETFDFALGCHPIPTKWLQQSPSSTR